MFKFLLVPVLFLPTMLLGCAVDYSKPFVQCTVWAKEHPVGRGSNECLNYELSCVKPLVIRGKVATAFGVAMEQTLICVLPENYGKTSPSL
jgi:hypothetical protein